MLRQGAIVLCVYAAQLTLAGEIIIDPVRGKAQAIAPPEASSRHDERRTQALEDARLRSGREVRPVFIDNESEAPAMRSIRKARGHIDESAVQPAPILIIKNGPPPSEASLAREKTHTMVVPPNASDPGRCRTENTVGVIEGTAQGHSVIQSNTSGVSMICK